MANIKNPNLQDLCKYVLDKEITHQNSDWSKKLTNDQIKYAAQDAVISYKIFIELIKPSIDLLKYKYENTFEGTEIIIGENCEDNEIGEDYISKLNILLQKEKRNLPTYESECINNNFPKQYKVICKLDDKY